MDKEVEIEDTGEYGGGEKELKFSHQSLVMTSMQKCIELGSHEMSEGHEERYTDARGNIKIIYKENTILAFIEAIKTLKMIVISDFDKTATENIGKLLEKVKERKDYWTEMEWGELMNIPAFKRKYSLMKGYFLQNSRFRSMFEQELVEIYREIFEELSLLTKRLDYYASEEFEG